MLDEELVSLRLLKKEDAYTSVKWRNNAEIWKHTIDAPQRFISLSDELKWIEIVITQQNSVRFAILYDGIYIGNVQLTEIKNHYCFFGIFIGETNFWGKGIAEKATILTLVHAFEELNLIKVILRVRINHLRAIKLYSRIGFKVVSRDEELIYMEIGAKDFYE